MSETEKNLVKGTVPNTKKVQSKVSKNVEKKETVAKAKKESKPKTEVKPKVETKTKSTANKTKAETKTVTKTEAKVQAETKVKSQTKTQNKAAESKPKATAKTQPTTKKQVAAKPKAEPKKEAKAEVENKPKTESKPKAASKPKTEAKQKKEETVKEENKQEKDVKQKQEETKNEKEDTVSLKQIREALENKVSENQKHSIIKENIINIMIAVAIILYLIIVFVGSKNIQINTLEIVLKVFSMCFAVIGLIILEIAYKKDNLKILLSGGEILIFGATNLCMMYVAKLYPANLLNVTTYISIAVAVYYLGKIAVLTIKSIKKYKKDNSDIKEIIKK